MIDVDHGYPVPVSAIASLDKLEVARMEIRTGLPEPIQSHWHALHDQVVWLHGRWLMYRQLFGTSPERVDLLNESAATFFFMVQHVVLDDVQLTLSKLGDLAQSRRHRNLTLESLLEAIRPFSPDDLVSALDSQLLEYRTRIERIRKRRNKQLAHFDFETFVNGKSSQLPGVTRVEIEDALTSLRSFMNRIEGHFFDSETAYEHFISSHDGEALLTVLKCGIRYRGLEKEGAIPRDDLEKSRFFRV